ncbi:MAG: AsmA family protein [Acidiferrobacteraceae bacterium]
MRTFGRVAGLVVLLLALLFAGTVLVLPHIINPNAYTQRLVALVRQKTGRTLTIKGRIRLSFFPWLGVRFSQASLSNPPRFGGGTFASIRRAGIRVRLLPLFRHRVVIDEIRLVGLRVHLVRNRAGADNWSGLTLSPAPRAAPAASPTQVSPMAQALSVAGVRVTKAGLVFTNEKTGTGWSIQGLTFSAGRLVSGRPVRMIFAARVTVSPHKVSTHISGTANVSFNEPADALTVSGLQVNALGATATARLHLQLAPALQVTGVLTVLPFNARTALARLGMKPALRDPRALTRVALSAGIDGTAKDWTFAPLAATFDGSHLTGRVVVMRTGPQTAYHFLVAVDALDLDRYRAPPTAPAPRASTGGHPPSPAPPAFLRHLDAQGTADIGHLTIFGVHASQVRVVVNAHRGVIDLKPLSARFYEGADQGAVRYDVAGPVPRLAVTERLTHIAFGPLLRDAGISDRLSGTGDLSGEITAEGSAAAALAKTLNGHAKVAFARGHIKGVNLNKIVAQAQALYYELRGQHTTVPPVTGDETVFSTLTASAVIHKGVVENHDLLLSAPPYLHVTGRGLVDLVRKDVDYRFSVTAKNGTGRALALPVTVRGPLATPSYHVDLATVMRSREQNLIHKERRRLKSRLRALHDRLKGLLQ